MAKRVILLTAPLLLFSQVLEQKCDSCHSRQIPYEIIYKRALLKYSSKNRILENLTRFLTNPASTPSILPPGLQRRFDPSTHPRFDEKSAKEAIKELIEKEDIIKKFK